jgi:p21-activated kinase 1
MSNTPKRLSDGGKDGSKKNSKLFSLFKSTPSRRPTISAPSNATHITHVGIDNETGKLTVR